MQCLLGNGWGPNACPSALLSCHFVLGIGKHAHALFGIRRPRLHPDTWYREILCDGQFSDVQRAQIISVMWSVWHSRNRVTHDDEQLDPFSSIKWIREDLALLDIPHSHASILPGHGWDPPADGVIKSNTHAAVSMDSGKVGAGGVARSCNALLGAWTGPHNGVSDPFIGETMALRYGVIFAKLCGFV
ncbi:hypothetical protein ZWY2020_004450 [Hordeum vulgare]|nr:hypothetical protein ZWY2020_004450 [Hordeum vulgare]